MAASDKIKQATAELLVEAGGADVSTRAICERAGVGPPALYRNFGDKDALIAAVVAEAFDAYLGSKRDAEQSEDPLEDLRDGWDTHTRWALGNPAYYRLIFGSGPDSSAPAAEAMRLLRGVLDRCAAAGLLVVSAELAAQMIMSANVGVALMLIRFPALYTAEDLSIRVRDAVHTQVLTPARAAATETAGPGVAVTAATLQAQLASAAPTCLSDREAGLLDEWLHRLADRAAPPR